MEPIGPSKYRPYYNPSPQSYLSTRTELLDTPGPLDSADLADGAGATSRAVLTALFRSQLIEYIGIALAQPFENAKIVMQCQYVPESLAKSANSQQPDTGDDEGFDEEADPDYFSEGVVHSAPSDRRTTDRDGYIVQNAGDEVTVPAWQLKTQMPPALMNVMDTIWTTEGFAGSFKATNLSFVYSFLRELLEGQLSGFISVLMGIPDPAMALEVSDTGSLITNLLSVALSALLLAPLDIARTKIILTPISEPRGILYTLRSLPSRLCPPGLLLPTLTERMLPLLLDYSLINVIEPVSNLVQLCVRLPLETVLRRAQASYSPPQKSIVQLGAYTGVFGTPWWIATQEGDRGLGLYRGWKAGVWGVLGVWSLGLVAASQERRAGTEF